MNKGMKRHAVYWIVPLMVVATVGCLSKPLAPITPPSPPPTGSKKLGIGASSIAQRTYGQPPATGTLSTDAATTQTSGSVLLISLARGDWSLAPSGPTDNHSNTFKPLGSTHTYIDWPSSAASLYHTPGATGGSNHIFSMLWGDNAGGDEVSLSAIEVTNATAIEDSSWVERSAANTISSASVHANGPAMLVAWWWGSGGVLPKGSAHKAVPGKGFTLIPNATGLVSLGNGYIQVAAAYRVVNAAGDYAITWDTDNEGSQLYLVAVR